ncbi:MAG: DUF2155 domain-containing protein [Rhodospirillales bacterium]|nr:DUF2155 domain-containing protein [Rhodospirillales bacterium]MDE0378013.1 DUF2155 domain-containing protein [Rhodospirillales bacterium]
MKPGLLFLAAGAALGASLACGLGAAAAEREVAVLQALDKVVARTSELEAPLDRPVRFGTLRIIVRACHAAPPEEPPENAAFLEIDEVHHDESAVRLYTGWMFSSTPGLAALEHPVYDIWVLACGEAAPAGDTAASEKPAG